MRPRPTWFTGWPFRSGAKPWLLWALRTPPRSCRGETATLSSSDAGGQGWTAVAGDQTVTAIADDGNLIAESNEDDNKLDKSFVVGQPNLIIDSVTVSPSNPKPGESVTFGAVVRNAGNAPTPEGVVHGMNFQIGGKSVAYVGNSHTASLAPGQTVTLKTTDAGGQGWTAVVGSQTVTASADNENLIAESNEDDNKLDKTFVVGQPNLIIDSVTVSALQSAIGRERDFWGRGSQRRQRGHARRRGFGDEL